MRALVLDGGRSSEHDVSLASGSSVRAGLAEAGHEVVGVEIGRDGVWRRDGDEISVTPGRGLLGADVVFPILHGPFGEDGTVQGLLEVLDVPYVGAGVLASAVCMDKLVFKDLMAAAGLPQVAYEPVLAAAWGNEPAAVSERLGALGYPLWVKPARLGSSVGIVRVADASELEDALSLAFGHDPRVIAEASATGLEVECSVLGSTEAPEASQPGEIVLRKGAGWYDYEAKYEEGGMELEVPARISETARERLRALARESFTRSGCHGLARVDFFVDGEDVTLNELNTMPGFTRTSVYGKLWAASGVRYADVLDRLATLAVERHREEHAYRF